jgi:hypothetical protein
VDADGVPDFADGFNFDGVADNPSTNSSHDDASIGTRFVPLLFQLPPEIEASRARVKFEYGASDPSGVTAVSDPLTHVTTYTPASGYLRLWRVRQGGEVDPGNQENRDKTPFNGSTGDFLPSGIAVRPQFLNSIGNNVFKVWVEAVGATSAQTDPGRQIKVWLDPKGDGNFIGHDEVIVSAAKVDVLIGANDADDESLHDDWVGAIGNGTTHKILNFVRVHGPSGIPLNIDLVVKKPWQFFASPISLSATNFSLTPDLSGVASASFLITGGYASAAPEDIMVQAVFDKQVMGSQTLTVVKFSTEPETYGRSNIPVNPSAVSARALAWNGNVFGADTAPDAALPFNNPHLSDVPYTTPFLNASKKIKYSEIEVIWGRDHLGTKIKSGAANSPLKAPVDNGTLPAVADNLRIQDTMVNAAMESAGGKVKYVLGHPTESVQPTLDVFGNNAASIEARVLVTRTFPVGVNVMQLVNAAGVVLGTLPVTDADVTEIFQTVNTILSQASLEFVMPAPNNPFGYLGLPIQTTDPSYFDTTGNSFDNLITQYASAAHVDIFLVRTHVGGGVAGETVYPGQINPILNDDPGIVLSTLYSPTGPRRTNAELGRTLAHEFLHYAIKTGSHSQKPWNLFAGSEHQLPSKRDIDDDSQGSQLQDIIDGALSPNNPDE